jgi:hypothetical protein
MHFVLGLWAINFMCIGLAVSSFSSRGCRVCLTQHQVSWTRNASSEHSIAIQWSNLFIFFTGSSSLSSLLSSLFKSPRMPSNSPYFKSLDPADIDTRLWTMAWNFLYVPDSSQEGPQAVYRGPPQHCQSRAAGKSPESVLQ